MKKFLLSSAILTICAITSVAKDNPVTIESGNLAILKQNVAAVLEFDYSQLTIDGMPEAEYLAAQDDEYRADWPGVVSDSEAYFPQMFNKYIKNGMNISATTSPQYKIIVQIRTLSLGNMGQMFNPFSGIKGGGAEISGKIFFVNLESGQSECIVSFAGIKGNSSYTESIRWGIAYTYLTKTLGKLVRKS